MTGEAATKGRGRPRTLPAGISAADRAADWQRGLVRAGGHRIPVNLGASAWRELQKLAGRRERGPLIERLILEEAARRRRERAER